MPGPAGTVVRESAMAVVIDHPNGPGTAGERRDVVAARGHGWRRLGRSRHRGRGLVLVVVLAMAVPVPWRLRPDSPALAWRLDGRLEVDGRQLDPPGTWSWLTVGRPPVLGEVLVDALDGGESSSVDLRRGAATSRPAVVEPVAAAVGLRAAGRDVAIGVDVEVSGPRDPRLPEQARLVELNGIRLTDRAAWGVASIEPGQPVTVRLADGTSWTTPGRTLPWADIDVIDVPPADLDAALFGSLSGLPPVQWVRDRLALGPSHGLMVALTTWAATSDTDLGGVHVAGTGGIRGDGRVTPIGGLAAKAGAARDAGADVLFFPLPQAGELDDVDPGTMALVGVTHIDDAIAVLERRAGDDEGPSPRPQLP